MARFGLVFGAGLAVAVFAASPGLAQETQTADTPASSETTATTPAGLETREAYLDRLRDVCAVECLKPKDFRRKARRMGKKSDSDLAVMMDVRDIRRDGENYLLLSEDLRLSNLETLAILEGAGINTSGRDGVGGLPRGAAAPTNPDLIIIELDAQTVADLLRVPVGSAKPRPLLDANGDIIVEGDVDRKRRKPTEAGLSNTFINRRIVVRGSTRLEPTWIGGRLDYRRKQVSLVVDNADDLVMLPRYDKDGNPIFDGRLAGLAPKPAP